MKKTSIGIDISMDDFHVCIKVKTEDGAVKVRGPRTFRNTDKGFDELLQWVLKKKEEDSQFLFVMEATGTYYENLAHFLYGKGQEVSVMLPNKVKSYGKSLNVKTKTDKADSKLIAELGIERKLEKWQPMSPEYKHLRDLCRELLSFKKEKQRAKNQLHSMIHSHEKPQTILDIKTGQIDFYEKSITVIEKEIKSSVGKDRILKERTKKLETIPGIGFETAIILICETNGFALIKSIRQLVSYAGLDVTFNESGKFKGKSRISKRGNSRIRQALYMPALSATSCNVPIKKLHDRICKKNPGIKQKGVVAGMRKLLVLAYTLWKKDEAYDKNYQWGREISGNDETTPSFGLFVQQKKAGPYRPALDRLLFNEPTEAFF
jgi:transposase